MKQISNYKNGNYNVTIYEDGTKIMENDLDYMEADFPDNFDFKITNYCEMGCPMCHERSNINGKSADLMNLRFIDSLHKGTEVALGGGMVTSHENLVPFLIKLRDKGIIANITLHQNELYKNWELIRYLSYTGLVHGIGVSFSYPDVYFWNKVFSNFKNIVIHTIAGIHDISTYKFIRDYIDNPKVLVLGYKRFGRGSNYFKTQNVSIYDNILKLENWLFKENNKDSFNVLSFDNLAINQLQVKDHTDEKEWNERFQGEDGTHTMYIDGVNKKFALNSTSTKRYDLLDNIDDMFKIIKESRKIYEN